MRVAHVIVPAGIDDPARPSGGNVYDRRLCRGLAASGWAVREHALPGAWPRPDAAACAVLTGLLAGLDDGAVVVLDGLVASSVPGVSAAAGRLQLVVLVHMLLASGPRDAAGAVEGAVLWAATAIVATSEWTKARLLELYGLPPGRIEVIAPGADAAAAAPGTADGGALLCVAALTPAKGHDVLIAALGEIRDLAWNCVCVGSADLDPGFVERLHRQALEAGIADRIRFLGVRTAGDLAALQLAADVLVHCSRAETYGMVVAEALARGLPVIAAAVGGVPEALGYAAGATRPGLLVPPDDPAAVAAALRRWLGDAEWRLRLRTAARQRRETLPSWPAATAHFADVLARVGA